VYDFRNLAGTNVTSLSECFDVVKCLQDPISQGSIEPLSTKREQDVHIAQAVITNLFLKSERAREVFFLTLLQLWKIQNSGRFYYSDEFASFASETLKARPFQR
jgi:hypothetical protein